MVIDLLGVQQDGTTRDDTRVPPSTRMPIELVQGSSLVARLSVVTPAGMAVALEDLTDLTLYLTVRQTPQAGDARISALAVLQPLVAKNAALFTITPAQTRALEPGLYVYDVWLASSEGRDCLIPVTQFHVSPGLRLP